MDESYTTLPGSFRGAVVAFVRRKGNAYYLVHNVRQRGKVKQLHLARLGERPRITDDIVRQVSRQFPLLDLNWSQLREAVSGRVELFDVRSGYVRKLIHSLRDMNLNLAELAPPLMKVAEAPETGREMVTQLRLLHSTVEVKLNQFEQADRRSVVISGRRFR